MTNAPEENSETCDVLKIKLKRVELRKLHYEGSNLKEQAVLNRKKVKAYFLTPIALVAALITGLSGFIINFIEKL